MHWEYSHVQVQSIIHSGVRHHDILFLPTKVLDSADPHVLMFTPPIQ